jgi:hypothetical protein
MSSFFIPMLSPLQWVLLALVPPAILLLYFLKLKRMPIEVPSTYLWQRTIEDLHVNTIWQRLRQSLLLFLQILLIVLLALALLRPGQSGMQLEGNRFIFALDTSASMTSTDVTPTRFDMAKKQIETMIDQMKRGDVAMLISFSSSAIVEHSFTDNRRSLRQRLSEIKPTNRTSNLEEVLRQAAGLANPGRSSGADTKEELERDAPVAQALAARLFIVSDGGMPPVLNFSLGNIQPEYVRVGEDTAKNLGIIQMTADRNPTKLDQTQIFVQVQNTSDVAEQAEVSLYMDGTLVDAQQFEIKPNEPGGAEFNLKGFDRGILEARLKSGDDMSVDDKAAIAVNIPRRTKILLVTPGNHPFELALDTPETQKIAEVFIKEPSILETKEHLEQAAAGEFDLIIYDQCVPKEMPQANTLTIGNAPPAEGWKAGAPAAFEYHDHSNLHPLFQLIESVKNIFIFSARPLTFPEGGTALMNADIGVIVAIAPREGFEDAALGFDFFSKNDKGETEVNTNWPKRMSFPVFVQNVVNYLGGQKGSLVFKAVQPSEPAILKSVANTDKIRVKMPSGAVEEVRREGQNNFVFTQTTEMGIYDVLEGTASEPTQQFAVNLCDQRESDIRPALTLDIGVEKFEVKERTSSARQEYWKWILFLGLAVLIFEWYVYNKRVYF